MHKKFNGKRNAIILFFCILLICFTVFCPFSSLNSVNAAFENRPLTDTFPLASGDQCYLVAHRGSQNDYPGDDSHCPFIDPSNGYHFTNTKNSINYAVRNGADVIEMDLRLVYSSNEEGFIPVFLHDHEFDIDGDGENEDVMTPSSMDNSDLELSNFFMRIISM